MHFRGQLERTGRRFFFYSYDKTTVCGYDLANMLSDVRISTPEADGQGKVTYRKDGQINGYNASGQRVTREDFIWNDKDSDGEIDVTGDDLTDERENEYETKFYYTGSAILYTANSNNYLLTENILDPSGSIIASARFDFGNPDVPDDYFFYNYDKRGSTTAILQPDGSLKTGYEYDEFGNLEQSGDAGFLNDVTFTGSVTDKSTGLQYMNARHYNPQTGRFLSQDSYTGNPYDPWTQHLYSYCGNNPTNYIDPTGHRPIMGDDPWNESWTKVNGEWKYNGPIKKDTQKDKDKDSPPIIVGPQLGEVPPESSGYKPPKGGPKKGWDSRGKRGWVDENGNIWVPDPSGHGNEHWDVERGDGRGYDNVDRNGKIRRGKGVPPVIPNPQPQTADQYQPQTPQVLVEPIPVEVVVTVGIILIGLIIFCFTGVPAFLLA